MILALIQIAPPREVSRRILSSDDTRRVGPFDDSLYLVDTDPVILGDLRVCHPVAGQSADSAELRGGYRAGFPPDRPLPFYRLRLGRCFALCRAHRDHRRNSKDARLASRLVLG